MTAGADLPPGPRLPRAWQLARYQLAPVAFMEACAARYGGVFTLRMAQLGDVVVATEPAGIRTVLTSADDRFVDGAAVRAFEPIVGPAALMLSRGEAHARRRQVLAPAFHRRLVERWTARIGAIADAELARLPVGVAIAMRDPARRIALEVLGELVFGIAEPSRRALLRDAIERPGLARELVLLSCFPALWRRHGRLAPGRALKRSRDTVHALLLAQIAARRTGNDGSESSFDALSLLAGGCDAAGERLGDAELRDQLVALLLAGHDTSAAALAWAVERIARHPRVQARLAGEVAQGGTSYLQAVVHESLRTRPAVVDVPRTTAREIELGGHRIPPGTRVNAVLAVSQRRADLWEDPLAFRPERFLDGRPVPYAFVPFGGGNRGCIAAPLAMLQLQVALATLVRRFVVEPAPGPQERARLAGMTLAPARGARVVLRRRQIGGLRPAAAFRARP
jgi:cytochrome P450